MIDVDPDLLAFLKEEYDRCRDEQLEDERETAIDRYNGRPYGDEVDGRSQVVARDTAEVVNYMLISVMRTIVSGDDVVEFDHENADLAHQATRTIKWLLMKKQHGYRALHDWLKAGLLEKNAVVMAYPEPQPNKRRVIEGVSAMALLAQGIEPIEAEQVGEDPEQGPILNVTVMEPQPPKFCVDAVPNEEFYCSLDARTITEAPLKGRRRPRPIHELVAEGIDPDELEGLGSDAWADSTLAQARDSDRHTDWGSRRGQARNVWWHEEYVTYDANGDGIAETLYIRRTGDYKIFAIEELDDPEDHPFEDWCPFPMQHRRIGQSLADNVMDLERVNTVLMRQSLDGIYFTNNPRTWLHEDAIGENTVDDLLQVRPGAIVRWKGTTKPETHSDRFDAANGFTMLEYMDRKRETRTGITRLNMGLDERTHNDTAKGQDQLQNRGDQVEEYVARNFADPLARLFTKFAKLLKRHGQPMRVPIDGEYIDVDPRQWPDDMIAEPKLGLGATRKEKRLERRREIIGYQMAALEAGLSIVDEQKFFNSAKGIVADAGLGDAGEYFNDPSKPELGPDGQPVQKPEKPDPEMMKVQADMQAKQAELQMKHQQGQAQLQLKLMEIQGKLQLAGQDAQARLQLEQQKAYVEMQLAEQQAAMEAALERMKIAVQARAQDRDANRRDGESSAKIDNLRKGGRLNK